MTDVLIQAAALADRLRAEPGRIALLDVRWALGDTQGHARYLDGHLPGAVFVDLDAELAAPASPEQGRHPLPGLLDLQAAARRWGIRRADAVVVYDATGNTAAARAWWLLRWGGLADVRMLDGGLAAWADAGGGLQRGEARPEPGDVTLTGGGMPVLDADAAATLAREGVLLDARAEPRYRGEVEPIDPRPGHIPGARSAPASDNLDAGGFFLPAPALLARFGALDARPGAPVGAYCGSGVTAAHDVAALAIAGIDAALYPGSWSQWSADPSRPAATGPDRG